MSNGVIYVATGNFYVNEAINSVNSLKEKNNLTCAIYTDQPEAAKDYFDLVIPLENPANNFFDKINPLINSPFDNTLFLDTDTFVCDSIENMFQLLEQYDIAAAHAPGRSQFKSDCPEFFPELNTGVILYKKNQKIINLFKLWSDTYTDQISKSKVPHDQPSFRSCLYQSQINIYILPPEYNFRTLFPGFVGSNMKVKIIHGRHKKNERIANNINQLLIAPKATIPDIYWLDKEHFFISNTSQYNSKIVWFFFGVLRLTIKLLYRLRLANSNIITKVKG